MTSETWRAFEKDFRAIPALDMRAGWSSQDGLFNHWDLAGGTLEARERFRVVVRLAGKALLDPAIASILPGQVLKEPDPFARWLTAIRSITDRFKISPVVLYDREPDGKEHRTHVGDINSIVDSSASLCLQLAAVSPPEAAHQDTQKSKKRSPKGFEGLGKPKTTFNEYDLSVLTERQNTAFRLKIGYELSDAKIADRMSISRQAVMKLLKKGGDRLNKYPRIVKSRRSTE